MYYKVDFITIQIKFIFLKEYCCILLLSYLVEKKLRLDLIELLLET